jgi:DNA polymerase (family 10)
MPPLNDKVAAILYEIADLLELKEESFKPRAYRRAARNIETMQVDVGELATQGRLKDIEGVGDAIAEKISEIVRTGKLQYLEDLRAELPPGLTRIMDVPDIGPRTAIRLYKEMGISDIDQLRAAAEAHRIRSQKGFGEKTEENILKGIKFVEMGTKRMLLSHAYPLGKGMEQHMRSLGHTQVSVAGSLRRMKETIGDIDILVASDNIEKAMDDFATYKDVEEVLWRGPAKTSVRLKVGTQIDLLVVKPEEWGAAMQYFTGSKEHNVELRSLAIDKGMKINEYGLWRKEDNFRIASRTEEEIYSALGMTVMPPEIREAHGEITASINGRLPKLVELHDIKGDLHMHTSHSDGSGTMRAMAEEGIRLGYEYIAITDHSRTLKVGNGLSVERLQESIAEARLLSEELAPFRVLIGSEVEIDSEGMLDYPKEILDQLDIVVGSVHSNMRMEPGRMTARILKALSHDNLDILAHPSGRLLNQREPMQFDMAAVMDAAKGNRVALELNSYPDRLDITDLNCRAAVDKDVMISIDSDSHSVADMGNMLYGVATARRGWAEKKNILNTMGLEELLRYLG